MDGYTEEDLLLLKQALQNHQSNTLKGIINCETNITLAKKKKKGSYFFTKSFFKRRAQIIIKESKKIIIENQKKERRYLSWLEKNNKMKKKLKTLMR